MSRTIYLQQLPKIFLCKSCLPEDLFHQTALHVFSVRNCLFTFLDRRPISPSWNELKVLRVAFRSIEFFWPQSAGEPGAKIKLAPQALQLLLDGVELKGSGRRAWYEAPE